MKCRKCKQPFELNQLTFKRYGTVKGSDMKQYAALCGPCLKEVEKK